MMNSTFNDKILICLEKEKEEGQIKKHINGKITPEHKFLERMSNRYYPMRYNDEYRNRMRTCIYFKKLAQIRYFVELLYTKKNTSNLPEEKKLNKKLKMLLDDALLEIECKKQNQKMNLKY